MAYRVEFTADAKAELDAIVAYIAADAPGRALSWLERFRQLADTLAHHPERCAVAPEARLVNFPVRQLLYGNYRVLYTITDSTVYVLHVRHAARRWMRAGEIKSP
ncbi:MAG: type II toxin-antitoxin system RelE/ParE family toxin [Pirellulales bacterium]|nr:type II toxin-antitoxin system RelE/ParE family toxin [Pirellulales bacterium]